jgi:hypothetical protein
MPRTKKTTEAEVSPVAATEQPKRKRTATPKSTAAATPKPATAASHKHKTKKSTPQESPSEQPVAVPVISQEEIARLAYSYWEARGFGPGSPEEDWLRAERELLVLAQDR